MVRRASETIWGEQRDGIEITKRKCVESIFQVEPMRWIELPSRPKLT